MKIEQNDGYVVVGSIAAYDQALAMPPISLLNRRVASAVLPMLMLCAVLILNYNFTLMSYTISKKEVDTEYYGYETEYSIDFVFEKQKANVTIELWPDEPQNKCRLHSNTDGYHWLQFFLCQEPNTKKMLELDFKGEVARCQAAFAPFAIEYEQEDKETAWLTYNKPIDEDFVNVVAAVIEPRFANRERFFE